MKKFFLFLSFFVLAPLAQADVPLNISYPTSEPFSGTLDSISNSNPNLGVATGSTYISLYPYQSGFGYVTVNSHRTVAVPHRNIIGSYHGFPIYGPTYYTYSTTHYSVTYDVNVILNPGINVNASINVATNGGLPPLYMNGQNPTQEVVGQITQPWAVTYYGINNVYVNPSFNLGSAVLFVYANFGTLAAPSWTLNTISILSVLYPPGPGQVELAYVSTSQPEYQTLVADRGMALNYANAAGIWPYSIRRRLPGPFYSGYRSYTPDLYYEPTRNVFVLEDTETNGYTETFDGLAPTSRASQGIGYDPDHNTVYAAAAGPATLPYSAVMALLGPGASAYLFDGIYYQGQPCLASLLRIPNSPMAIAMMTSGDDAGNSSSYIGYALLYAAPGTLPGDPPPPPPPSGVITSNLAQVLTTKSVNLSWNLN